MADRRYAPDEIEIDPKSWVSHVGQEYRLAGIVFQSYNGMVIAMLPDAHSMKDFAFLHDFVIEDLSIEEWHAILKRSDDPLIFQRDEIGTLKGWIRKAQNIISGEVQQKVWARDNYSCMFCGKRMGEVLLTVDHWMPLELFGTSSPNNLISMCRAQNKMKGSMHPKDFCELIGKPNLFEDISRYLKTVTLP